MKIGSTIALVLGGSAFAYGCWLAWHPLGFMIGGLLVLLPAFFVAYASKR